MIGLQFVAIIFALWMLYFSYLHYRRHEFTRIEFALWEMLWLGLIIVVVLPHSVQFLLDAFSITRTFDLVVVVGIVILFGVTFRNYVITKRIRKQLEDVVRQSAIQSTTNDEKR